MFFTDHKECDYCKRTPGRKLSLVRHPFPDKNRERFHYCHVNDPSVNERDVDDFQPCAQLQNCLRKVMDNHNVFTCKVYSFVIKKKLIYL